MRCRSYHHVIVSSILSSFPLNICLYSFDVGQVLSSEGHRQSYECCPAKDNGIILPTTSRMCSSSLRKRKAVTDRFPVGSNDVDYEAIPISLTFCLRTLWIACFALILALFPLRLIGLKIPTVRNGKFFLGNLRSIMHVFSWKVRSRAPSPLLFLVFLSYLLHTRRIPPITIRPF